MITVYLDEHHRTPNVNHLEDYLSSCFYTLLSKGVKERGKAYEEIAEKVLKAQGFQVERNKDWCGSYDIVLEGLKCELKASRKASKYDGLADKRPYQFNQIRGYGDYDSILLMVLKPDDVVEIWSSTFDDLKPYMKNCSNKTYSLWGYPKDFGCSLVTSVKMK